MPRPLPPLNALRAFEAAARHLSFTRAAEELHVTQAAVSHQVKALEERVGVKLFRRLTRGLLLTEDGHALLPDLREAFDRLAQAVDRIGRQGGQGTLTISLLTTFALGWLVPRLPRFQEAHPSIDVRLTTTARLIDFAVEDVDVAVRYGTGGWAGLRCDKIFDDVVTPLCNARFKERLRKHEDILNVPLLHEQYEHDWRTWFRAAGISVGQLKKGPTFEFDARRDGGGDRRHRRRRRRALPVHVGTGVGAAAPALRSRRAERQGLLAGVARSDVRAPEDQGAARLDAGRGGHAYAGCGAASRR